MDYRYAGCMDRHEAHRQLLQRLRDRQVEKRLAEIDRRRDEKKKEQRKEETAETEMVQILTLTAAQWDRQEITIAGVVMTNKEAQEARRRVLANPDYYADRAVQQGLIRPDQQPQLIHDVHEAYEIEAAKRVNNGQVPDAMKSREAALKQSDTWEASELMTVQSFHDRTRTPSQEMMPAQANKDHRHADPFLQERTTDQSLFPTAPDLEGAFAAAQAPGMEVKEDRASSPAPVRKPAATGFDF